MQQRDFHLQRMNQFLRRSSGERNGRNNAPIRPSLTVSRQCGSRCNEIQKSLVEYLDEVDPTTTSGWACFGQSLIGKLIEDRRLRESAPPFSASDLRFPLAPALQETLRSSPSHETLFDHCADAIRLLCDMGNAIIIGRAGNFVTADLGNTFHVRLVGSETTRTAYTRQRYQLDEEKAKTIVEQVDLSRKKFVRRHAHADVGDTSAYHLVINTDNISDKTLVRIIGDSLIEWAEKEADTPEVALFPFSPGKALPHP